MAAVLHLFHVNSDFKSQSGIDVATTESWSYRIHQKKKKKKKTVLSPLGLVLVFGGFQFQLLRYGLLVTFIDICILNLNGIPF